MLTNSPLGKSLILLLIYEISMFAFGFDGLSIGKLVITILVWISFGLTFRTFARNLDKVRTNIPPFPLIIIILLILWNLITVLRSIFFDPGSIKTIFGNTFTSLSLLVPFAIVYGLKLFSLRVLIKYYQVLMKIGLIFFLVFFLINLGGKISDRQSLILLTLLQPAVFLFTVLHCLKKPYQILILMASLVLFYVAFFNGVRTMAVRQILLFLSLVGVYSIYKFRWKWIRYISFMVVAIPFILVQQSVATGESAITKYLSPTSNNDLSVDTRTFVYKELYKDLIENDKLLIGKGANGRYYSDYFSSVEGDSPYRLNIEVGVLGFLLKGGLISVLLNLILIITAIGFAFFKSKNTFVIGMGFILLVHLVLLFLENVISYNSYNLLVWILIGICLSKTFRAATNTQILKLINV